MQQNNNLYFSYRDISLYCIDCLDFDLPDGTIDFVLTSPPYNVGIDYGVISDNLSSDEYLDFSARWLSKCFSWVKSDGRLAMVIPMSVNLNSKAYPTFVNLVEIAKKVGWKFYTVIVWHKKRDFKTAWGSWLSASAPYLIPPVEVIPVFYKDSFKKTSGSGISDIKKDEFLKWHYALWEINGENRASIKHPAPFPKEIPYRCIKFFTFLGDTILDPFAGSGTTLIVLQLLKRKSIGLEINKDYCELAKNRILAEVDSLEFV